jgi:hypothetical protein
MDDQQKSADARAALLESGDEDNQKAVLAWEKRNPHENEVGSYLEIGGDSARSTRPARSPSRIGPRGSGTRWTRFTTG